MDYRSLISSSTGSTMSNPYLQSSNISINPRDLMSLLALGAMFPGFQLQPYEVNADMYTYENLQLASEYLSSIIESREHSEDLLKYVVRLWFNSSTGDFPTLDDIVDNKYANKCDCLYNINEEDFKDMYKYFINRYGIFPSCGTSNITREFKILNNRFPTMEEIDQSFERIEQFNNNPEEFHQNDKVLVGVKNLEKIPVEIMDKNEFKESDNINCSMCQEEIQDGVKYIKLPCKHLFHYDGDNCLEGATVVNWLENHKHCPNCKQEVKLD